MILKTQIENFKVELAGKNIQPRLCKFVILFKAFEEIMQLPRRQKREPEYILIIYVFQLRKFAIVGKKDFSEVQKINIYISSTSLPLTLYEIVH